MKKRWKLEKDKEKNCQKENFIDYLIKKALFSLFTD